MSQFIPPCLFLLGVHYLQNIKRTHAVQCQKNKQHNKKWAKDQQRHSSEKDTQMVKKQVIRRSKSLLEKCKSMLQ